MDHALYNFRNKFIITLFILLLSSSLVLGTYYILLYENTIKILNDEAVYVENSITLYLKESIKKKNNAMINFYKSSTDKLLDKDDITCDKH